MLRSTVGKAGAPDTPLRSGGAPGTPRAGPVGGTIASHGPSSVSGGVQYLPRAPGGTARFLAVAVPASLACAPLVGPGVLGVLIAGLLVTYVLDVSFGGGDEDDASAATRGTAGQQVSMIALWATAVACVVGIYARGLQLLAHSWLNVCLLLDVGMLACAWTLWATAQSGWVRVAHPPLAIAAERAAGGVAASSGVAAVAWAYVARHGAADLGPFLVLAMSVAHFALVAPRESAMLRSTSSSGGFDPRTLAQSRGAAAVLTFSYLVLPALAHLAVHHRGVFAGDLDVLVALAAVANLPFMLLRIFGGGARSWWFLGISDIAVGRILALATPCSLAVLVGCFEHRVVFRSFAHYIALLPPYDTIVVTAVLYAGALLAYLHFAGHVRAPGRVPFSALLTVAAVAGCVAQGTPAFILPLVAGAALAVSAFYFDRKLGYYLAFVGCATGVLAWWLYHTFWFLDLSFETRVVVNWSLHGLVGVLAVLFVLTLAIPGLTIINQYPTATGALLAAHATGLASVEQILFDEFSDAYSPLLVMFTSALGCYLATRLRDDGRISRFSHWVLTSLNVAKLALLLHPVPWAVPSGAALVITVSPLHYHIRHGELGRSACAGLGAAVGAAALLTRNTIIRRVVEIAVAAGAGDTLGTRAAAAHALAAGGSTASPEQEFDTLVTAAALLVWAGGCAPIATRLHPHWPAARRWVVLLACAGVLLAAVRPPLDAAAVLLAVPGRFASAGDAGAAFALAEPADPVLAMIGVEPRPVWPRWALVASLMVAAAAATRALPLPRSDAARLACALGGGFTMGLYVAGAHLPPTTGCLAAAAAICSLHALLAVMTHAPTPRSHAAAPVVYALACAAAAAAWAAILYAVGPAGGRVGAASREALTAGRSALLAILAVLHFATALDISFVSGQHARARGSRVGGAGPGRGAAPFSGSPAAGAAGAPSAGAGSAASRLDPDMQWMPAIGNAATCASFALAVYLNVAYLGGSETCVFFLAPMLLLLSQDRRFLSGLTERRRYFPLVAVTSVALTASAFYSVLGRHILAAANLAATPTGRAAFSAFSAAKNSSLLAITTVTHWHACKFFWGLRRADAADWLWISLLPLQLLPVLAADVRAIQMLGAVGFVAGIVVIIVGRQIKNQGAKFI